MRNYYLFEKQNELSGWVMLPTVWLSRNDAYDALNFEQVRCPDSTFLIGHDDDQGTLTIAKKFNDIPAE